LEEGKAVFVDHQRAGPIDLMNRVVEQFRTGERAYWPRVASVIRILGISPDENGVGGGGVVIDGVEIAEAVNQDFVCRENFGVAWLKV
jgi:hypothetical protein